jgi:AsmA protein
MALPRSLRFLLLGAGAALVLLVLTAVALPFVVDVQRLSPLIAGQIEQATGRKATLGRITLRVLPAPGVTVSPVTVAEGVRYPGREALRLAAVSLRLRPWPLLRGRIEFGSVLLDQPTLTLIRDREGRWNFDDLLQRIAAVRSAAGAPAAGPANRSGGVALGVERAMVRGAKVLVYDDAVIPGKRSELTLGPIDATISGWGLGETTSIELSVGLGKSIVHSAARLTEASGDQALQATIRESRVEISDLVPILPWLGALRPAGMQIGGAATLEGKASLSLARLEAVQFEGRLGLENLSYRDATMKHPLEQIGGRLAVNGQKASWTGFTARFGSSDLRGDLQLEDYLHPRVGFKLESKRLDLNEMIETFSGGPAPAAPATRSPASGGASPEQGLLQQVAASGSLAVDALRFQTFDVGGVRGAVTLKNAVLSLQNLKAKLYAGQVSGDAMLDLSRPTPRYRLDTALKGVDVNALAGAYDPSLKGLLRGTLSGELGIEASGVDLKAILDTAAGSARIEIAKGALTSISVLKQLATLLQAAGGKGIGQDETPFDSLGGSFAIGGRRAETSNLLLDSLDLDLTGQGWVGLGSELNLAAVARFSEEASRGMLEKTPQLRALTDAKGQLALHLLARGTLAAPSIALDTKSQVQQIKEQQKERAKEKVKDRLIDLLGGKPKPENPPPPPR